MKSFSSTVVAVVATAATATASGLVGLVDNNSTNICGQNATIGAAVVRAMNLSWPGLEAAKSAADAGDLNGACEAIAGYYRNGTSASWERIGPVKPGTGLVGGFAGIANSCTCVS